MSEIDEQIWIGNQGDSNNEQHLKDKQITHILSCGIEFNHPPGFLYVIGNPSEQWHKIPIIDETQTEFTEGQFREGAAKINEWILKKHKIMVHCFAGISRSVSVVIAYYILYKGWSFDIALSHVKQRRIQANPCPSFIPILKSLS